MTTRGKRLEAELAVGFPVLFEILPGIFEPDFVLLQKAIEFVARFEAQQPAELGSRDLAFAISLKGDRFEGDAGEVLPRGSQNSGKLVGQIESKLHDRSIGEINRCSHATDVPR